ncbi:MAG TPA: ANTAR domain-containing protein [Steroidobacteraceae bacterium]|nr:ANTAR domain-containing protein [Steroidobacteraceae bacterium]
MLVVNVRSANTDFARELSRSLTAAGFTVEAPGVAPPEGILVIEVLDEPAPELAGLFSQNIILANAGDEALANQAIRAGAAALINKPVSMATLAAKVQLTATQLLEADRLRRQVEKLSALLTEEQTVSVAVGMLAERFHLSSHEAYNRLRRHARSTQSKLQSLAAQLVRNASTANELFRAAGSACAAPPTTPGLTVE